MGTSVWFWIAFNAAVLAVLAIDLFGFHRRAHAVSHREAAIWSAVWIALSLSFNALVWRWKGAEKGLEFLTGYLIEYSLSVDNLFVFVLIFSYFRVAKRHQHRILFWGIIGALVMRGAMIGAGVVLVKSFHWILYVFGLLLVVSGIKMLFHKEDEAADLERNLVVRLCRRLLPLAPRYHDDRFLVNVDGRWLLTPLALTLVVVEMMDLIFAVDSIPAIFGVTQDAFIVYTSNICAILGLRSLYFLLAGVVKKFIYLQTGIAVVLSFIGVKMLVHDWVHISTLVSLLVVLTVLATSVCVSVLVTNRRNLAQSGRSRREPALTRHED